MTTTSSETSAHARSSLIILLTTDIGPQTRSEPQAHPQAFPIGTGMVDRTSALTRVHCQGPCTIPDNEQLVMKELEDNERRGHIKSTVAGSSTVLPLSAREWPTMVAIDILKFATSSPADTSPLAELVRAGYDASQILAVIGKTEGEFCLTRHTTASRTHQIL